MVGPHNTVNKSKKRKELIFESGDCFMFLLDMFAAFCVAALAGMGIGGGGLLIIYLTLIRNTDPAAARYENLIFFVLTAGFSLFYHLRRRKIPWKAVSVIILFGSIGALLGCWFSGVVDSGLLRIFFGIFLIASGVLMLFKQKNK